MIIPDTAPKISNDKKSLNSRHILPLSFLFRRKEAKENQLRESGFSALQPLSPACNTKRTVHIRTVRFFLPNRTCGKASFLRLNIYPAMSFVSFLQEKKSFPFLFFLERKNGQLAREAQPLRRTDAGTSCVVVGRNTAAGMPPSSALSLPVSAAPARQLSRASRPRKRKSSAGKFSFAASAAFANVQHKTDGSYVNRPFFRALCRTCGKTSILKKNILPRSVFCFFSSRKENVPLQEKKSFPFRRKEIVPPKSAVLPAENAFQQ